MIAHDIKTMRYHFRYNFFSSLASSGSNQITYIERAQKNLRALHFCKIHINYDHIPHAINDNHIRSMFFPHFLVYLHRMQEIELVHFL